MFGFVSWSTQFFKKFR